MINRRSILRAALFVAAAPIIVRASSLMHVRALPISPKMDFGRLQDLLMPGLAELHGGGSAWGDIFIE